MASLELVCPGWQQYWGCRPYFFLEKNWRLFKVITVHLSVCHFCSLTPTFLLKNWRPFFLLITVHFYWFHLGVTPCRVSPAPFYLSDLVCPLFFVNSPTKFFLFGCHPHGGRHPGRSPLYWRHLDEQFLQFSSLGFVTLGPFHRA